MELRGERERSPELALPRCGVRVWIHSTDGFDRLVEMGVVEAHPWAATVDAIPLADRVGFRQPKPSRKELAVKLEPATL